MLKKPPGWPFDRPPLVRGCVGPVEWACARNGNEAMPAVNGYVRIPTGHAWSRIKRYYDIPVRAPGGLTWGPVDFTFDGRRRRRNVVQSGRWVGFDTNHAFDLWAPEELLRLGIEQPDLPPELAAIMKSISFPVDPWTHQWTIEEVVNSTVFLAVQFALTTGISERAMRHPGMASVGSAPIGRSKRYPRSVTLR